MEQAPVRPDRRPRADGEFGRIPFPDRFRIERVIGRGGSGVVFAAIDQRLRRRIALKVLQPNDHTDAPALHSHDEARTLASLSHPNLVAVHDTFLLRADGGDAHAFLVLEYVDGPDLHQYLRAGRLAIEQVVQLGIQLCSGLAYVHEQGFLHQDLKPSNVLLSFHLDGEVQGKLSDFGTAVVLHGQVQQGEFTVGTAAYLSPEQAEGSNLTAASDIYALGLVLLEAATGEVAFTGTVIEAAMARLDRDPDLPAALPADLREVLAGMTHRDPAARMDLRTARRRLLSLQQTLEGQTSAPATTAVPQGAVHPLAAAGRTEGATARSFRPQEEDLTELLHLAALTLHSTGTALLEHDGTQYRHRAEYHLSELETLHLRQQLPSRPPGGSAVHATEEGQFLASPIGGAQPMRFLVARRPPTGTAPAVSAETVESLTGVLDSAIRLRESIRRALFAR